jgi:hypothetical protein
MDFQLSENEVFRKTFERRFNESGKWKVLEISKWGSSSRGYDGMSM